MNLKYPVMRHQLEYTLLRLSDMDYQMEVWVKADRQQLLEYVGFYITTENLLDDVIWEEGNGLIGSLLRDNDELDACLEVVALVKSFITSKDVGLTDEEYISDPDWLPIISAARNALRVMNKGDK